MKRTVNLIAIFAAAAALVTLVQTFKAGTGSLHDHTGTTAHAASPAAARQRRGRAFRWREPRAAGRAIDIRGINGSGSAAPAPGGEVEVEAVKRARRSD